ncbi:hypothetical protein M4951_25585 [Blastopirellula sp. J2-11]|nr:hypothetical protein [Blastopirellula sp. J2-11]UUO06702.1 hypothetical protein M4951_25585 [Blastopirellula sp. J2-11]
MRQSAADGRIAINQASSKPTARGGTTFLRRPDGNIAHPFASTHYD